MAAMFFRHFQVDFFNWKLWISIKISLKFVPMSPVNNIPSLVQTMAWRRPGDKPLSEAMMVCLLTHICLIRPQWVNMIHVTSVTVEWVRWMAMAWHNIVPGHLQLSRWRRSVAICQGCPSVMVFHGISNHRQLDYFINNLMNQTSYKNIKASHHWSFVLVTGGFPVYTALRKSFHVITSSCTGRGNKGVCCNIT